jgi:16S rRNA processing protein RimM
MSAAPPPPPPGYLSIGYITKAQGLKGEVLVHLTTNRTERLAPDSRLHSKRGELTVVRAVSHGDRWRVLFRGVPDRTAAEALRGVELFAEPLNDPSELWVHELVGATVRLPDGTDVGRVDAVQANPASDLLVLDTGHLIPLVFVVSSAEGVVVIDPPEGLLELLE